MTMTELHHTSFDEGFEPYGDEIHLIGPVGWSIAWVPGEKPGPVRPEVQPELRSRGDRGIRTGEHGVKMCHAFSFFDGVFFRSFATAPGLTYRAQVYATGECPEGGLACRIGIDPKGGTHLEQQEITWSDWYGTDDAHWQAYRWQCLVSEVIAEATEITVFLNCACRYAHEVNAGFFDDFTLLGERQSTEPIDERLTGHINQLQHDLNQLKDFVSDTARLCILV